MPDLLASISTTPMPGAPSLALTRAAPVALPGVAIPATDLGVAFGDLLKPVTDLVLADERQAAAGSGKELPDAPLAEPAELAQPAEPIIVWIPCELAGAIALPPTTAASNVPLDAGISGDAIAAPARQSRIASAPNALATPVGSKPISLPPADIPGAAAPAAGSSATPGMMPPQIPLAQAPAGSTALPALTLSNAPASTATIPPDVVSSRPDAGIHLAQALSDGVTVSNDMPDSMMRSVERAGSGGASDPAASAMQPAPSPVQRAATPPSVIALPPAPMAGPAAQVFAAALATLAHDRKPAEPSPDGMTLLTAPAGLEPRQTVQAVGASAQGTLDLTRDDWTGPMIDRIAALRDAAEAADTRIKLAPENLGALEISIRRDGDRVHVHFTADNPAARQMIADATPRLAELADARGVKLGQTSVDGGGAQSGSQRDSQPFRAQTTARNISTTTPGDTDTDGWVA